MDCLTFSYVLVHLCLIFSEVVVTHIVDCFLTVQLLIPFDEEVEWTLQNPKGKNRAVADACRCVLRDSVEYE